jgi:leucyl/phenylalanyl-tRNA---protein transferase
MSNARIVNSLLYAYRSGYFPMADPDEIEPGRVGWFSPDPRALIPIAPGDEAGRFHVPRSLAQRVRSGRFQIRTDTEFRHVIEACAAPRRDDETWISSEIIDAYTALFEAGHAHSIEAWLTGEGGERLVGGLYGVAIGGMFAGESMFSRPGEGGTDASKVCLVHLVEHLRRRGFTLLDAQFWNPHLDQFGCTLVSRDEYHTRLVRALRVNATWLPFEPEQGLAQARSVCT